MTDLMALWLPILVSAVIVFAVSSVIHMFTPWHAGDYPKIPNEDRVMDALRPLNIPPGDYMFPRPSSMKDMSSPEFVREADQGPGDDCHGSPERTRRDGAENWCSGLSSPCREFLRRVRRQPCPRSRRRLPPHFPVRGSTAFAAYAFGLWPLSIWYRRSLGTTIRSTVDGLIYALLTAGTFGWLWPR